MQQEVFSRWQGSIKFNIHAEHCNTIWIVVRDYDVTEILEMIYNKMLRDYDTILKRENHFDESDSVKVVINIIN